MGAMKHFLSYGRKFALASNILFGVLSFAMSIAGFVMRFGDQPLNEGTLQKIKDSARDAFGVNDLSTNNFQPITESLKEAFGNFLIVTGTVSAPLVVFGFFTFLRKKRNFLFAYVIIIGCLAAAQLFVNFHFIKSPETVQEMMKPYLREKINEYVGIHSSDQVSLGWNYMMQEYQCCGVDSSADFKSSSYYSYYSSYCPSYSENNAVPGCCRTLPSSQSGSRCYYYYTSWNKYCGGNAYDTWKDGCSAALLGFFYTRNTKVIWSMIAVGLIDQIFLFVFAIILFRNTKCKVESATNVTTEVSTTGDTQTTHLGLPSTTSSAPVSLEPQLVISSTAPTQHSFLPGYVPPTSTLAAAAPPPPTQQQQPVISSTTQNQQSFYPVYVPPTSTAAAPPPPQRPVISSTTQNQQTFYPMHVPTTATSTAAALPPPQPVTQLTAPTQSNLYPMQPSLPGAVMPVHTSHDYARNNMPSTYIPMTNLPGNSMQALPQTQAPPAAQQLHYAPMTLSGNGMQALPQTQAPPAAQHLNYAPVTLPGNGMQALPQTQSPPGAQQQNYAPMTLPVNSMQALLQAETTPAAQQQNYAPSTM